MCRMSSPETSAAESKWPTSANTTANMQLDHLGLTPAPNAVVPGSHAQASSSGSCCQRTRPINNLHHTAGSSQTTHELATFSDSCVAANGSGSPEVDAGATAAHRVSACGCEVPRTTYQDTLQRLEILRRLGSPNKECLTLRRGMRKRDAASQEIRARRANRDRLTARIVALTRDVDAARRETRIARQRLEAAQAAQMNVSYGRARPGSVLQRGML